MLGCAGSPVHCLAPKAPAQPYSQPPDVRPLPDQSAPRRASSHQAAPSSPSEGSARYLCHTLKTAIVKNFACKLSYVSECVWRTQPRRRASGAQGHAPLLLFSKVSSGHEGGVKEESEQVDAVAALGSLEARGACSASL